MAKPKLQLVPPATKNGTVAKAQRRAAQKTKTCARGSICGPKRSSG
jgi:hypothetical protein